MTEKQITIIISDLHLGAGAADPGDDHVHDKNQLRNFLESGIPESRGGGVELFINGDFLEFAQVKPEVYKLGSPKFWCSEEESLVKLDAIVRGYADVFEALNEFQARENQVTIAAGNHDVDLHWEAVQHRLRGIAGPIEFALGKEWYYRHNNRLLIGHGHMFDPANRFSHWDSPILQDPSGTPRLEMCPGTLFMAKFVNWLERDYPFADNVKPVTALFSLLYDEDPIAFRVVLGTLLHFARAHLATSLDLAPSELSSDKFISTVGDQLVEEIALNDQFAARIVDLYHRIGTTDATQESARNQLRTRQDVYNLIGELVIKLSPDVWLPVFNVPQPAMLSAGNDERATLSILRSGIANDKKTLRKEAEAHLMLPGREVVVCGHTHQPDEWRGTDGKWEGGYFNPGSWTRYVDISKVKKLRLEDLRQEENFPYQLNYIRVEESTTGALRADKICYDEVKGSS